MDILLWLEAVDFDATLLDTNNLSVYRGASLAMLNAPLAALGMLQHTIPATEIVFSGASQGLFRLKGVTMAESQKAGDALLAELHASGDSPQTRYAYGHLTFVYGLAEEDAAKPREAPRLAQSRARFMQISASLPRRARPMTAAVHCPFTGHRPADTAISLREDHQKKYTLKGKASGGAQTPVLLSASAAARWSAGRKDRQGFYLSAPMHGTAQGLIPPDHSFTDNLQDMIDLKGCEALARALPVSIGGKIAVFYADGNGFTAIRDAMGGDATALADFAAKAGPILAEQLASMLDVVAAPARVESAPGATQADYRKTSVAYRAAVYHDEKEDFIKTNVNKRQLRIETLLFGGDEVTVVVPAWFGLQIAQAFFAAAKGKSINGKQLHYKAGLAFVPVKMPIQSSISMARALADDSARKGESTLAVHAFESIEPPEGGLTAVRTGIFGKTIPEAVSKVIVLDGTKLDDQLAALATVTGDGGLPRSQLFRLLRAAQWQTADGAALTQSRKLGDLAAGTQAEAAMKAYQNGAGQGLASRIGRNWWLSKLRNPETSTAAAWLMTHMWDYVDPLTRANTDTVAQFTADPQVPLQGAAGHA